jgi:hypothetical protein
MTSFGNNAPRRYFVDADGRRVLIGLTLEETFEFERLDGQPTPEQADRSVATLAETILWSADGEQRWLELYAKHDGAWKAWIAQNGGEQPAGFSLY